MCQQLWPQGEWNKKLTYLNDATSLIIKNVHSNISLPPGKLATTVQLAYSFAVVLTFPLQNFPSLEIVHRFTEMMLVNQTASSYSKQNDSTHYVMNIVSAMVVVLLSVIAISKWFTTCSLELGYCLDDSMSVSSIFFSNHGYSGQGCWNYGKCARHSNSFYDASIDSQ